MLQMTPTCILSCPPQALTSVVSLEDAPLGGFVALTANIQVEAINTPADGKGQT